MAIKRHENNKKVPKKFICCFLDTVVNFQYLLFDTQFPSMIQKEEKIRQTYKRKINAFSLENDIIRLEFLSFQESGSSFLLHHQTIKKNPSDLLKSFEINFPESLGFPPGFPFLPLIFSALRANFVD